MPTSIDPQPADNEIECANCGAYIYYELTRCPNCGVNLYEPEYEITQDVRQGHPTRRGFFSRLEDFLRQLTKRPYPADELFGASLDQAGLFNDLLGKVGGDRSVVERLILYEQQQLPQGNRLIWLENAIRRWEHDNQTSPDDLRFRNP
jgi:hypothetical protein